MPDELGKTERQALKQALQYLIVALKGERVLLVAMLGFDKFLSEVIRPLEKACRWRDSDEHYGRELIKKFRSEAVAAQYDTSEKKFQLLVTIIEAATIEDDNGIKRPLHYLKIANRFSHLGFKAFYEGRIIHDVVVEPLRAAYAWNSDDEQEAVKLSRELIKETSGKTFAIKRSRLKKILALSGAAVGAGLIAAFVLYLKKKKE